jgi:hypothetical protein
MRDIIKDLKPVAEELVELFKDAYPAWAEAQEALVDLLVEEILSADADGHRRALAPPPCAQPYPPCALAHVCFPSSHPGLTLVLTLSSRPSAQTINRRPEGLALNRFVLDQVPRESDVGSYQITGPPPRHRGLHDASLT